MSTNKITSAEIKLFLRKYLSEHEYYVYADFEAYLRQVTDKEYTKPQIGGVIEQFVRKHEIERVERGIYRSSIPNAEVDYKKQIMGCLKNTISNLSTIIKRVDLVALNDEDYAEVKKIRVLADQIRAVINDLADKEDKEAV